MALAMRDVKQTPNQTHDYYNVLKTKLIIIQIIKVVSKLSRPHFL